MPLDIGLSSNGVYRCFRHLRMSQQTPSERCAVCRNREPVLNCIPDAVACVTDCTTMGSTADCEANTWEKWRSDFCFFFRAGKDNGNIQPVTIIFRFGYRCFVKGYKIIVLLINVTYSFFFNFDERLVSFTHYWLKSFWL